ncbi:coiled-coil domain-containing protein 66 isoform X1 [Hippoglossus stenolepis]|uniref:coiled-coil domain-containing protein 66 isoform X1 n=1 Tax=Hippoglossus stenolepis TaxID=195615 RepID=UPI001FAFB044|nr:coiled-coil domain-containing protein 66 isoform X1 [Hippoglossus stenolepis]
MNLGDGLLFELENGKPRLILLSHGVEKNPNKLLRPRVTNVLSSRQPSCLEEVQGEERPARQQAGRYREARSKAAGAATSLNSHTSTTRERSTTLISSKTQEHLNQGGIKAVAKEVKSDRHKQSSTVASPRANGKTGKPQKSEARAGGKAGLKDAPASGDAGLRDNMVVLTREQLQQLLNTIKSQQPPEDHRTQGSQSGTSVNEGEMKEEDRGGGEVVKKGEGGGGGGGVTDTTGTSQDKDNRMSACLFSWMGQRQSDSRSVIDAKKAQWRRELDEQVELKAQQQQRWAPGRIQAEEDAESVLSVHSSFSHREQPAAIRSSLKLGEVTPMAEVLSGGRREEERRRWLEELNRQREEANERKRREKLLQNQTEDHELWATHFDSMQQRPPVHTAAPSAPPPAPSRGSERGDWEPSSSLSLVWEATSSCGAESVAGASVDTTNGYQSRARTMTALLDPTQIEERERRRLKQMEQQRAIEAQMEEQRQQREREEARRREEEETEARRLLLEREKLQRQYELDTLRERQKVQEKSSQQTEQPRKGHSEERLQETPQPSAVTTRAEHLEEDVSSSVPPFKDTAVQTEAVPALSLRAEVQTPDVSAQYQPAPFLSAAPPPNSKNPAVRTGKENICLRGGGGGGGGGGDPYETFARTERSMTDKRRPEWNTQRPSRRFVPASERYPAALQRNRQESRLKRQAELVALQGRTCLSRTEPPPPPPPHQDPRLCSNTQTRTAAHSQVGGPIISPASSNERGRSPPVPAVRHRVQSQQASNPLPPPVLDFIPYIRTDEITLDPLEPPEIPPPHTVSPQSSVSPPAPPHQDHSHTTRQQEILRSLAQLRQGLLQKQRELESDLNPLLKHHNNELRSPSAMHHK